MSCETPLTRVAQLLHNSSVYVTSSDMELKEIELVLGLMSD